MYVIVIVFLDTFYPIEDVVPIGFELIDTTDELTPLPPQDYPLSSIGNGQIPNSEQLMDYLQPSMIMDCQMFMH